MTLPGSSTFPVLCGEPGPRLTQDLVRQLRVITHTRQDQGTDHRSPAADRSATFVRLICTRRAPTQEFDLALET